MTLLAQSVLSQPSPQLLSAVTYADTTVIVPTLNEEANIGPLLGILLNLYPGIHVTVVDDGSKDRTRDIVLECGTRHSNVVLLDRSRESLHGLTISVIDAALGVETPYFVVIDGDLQHPPEKIRELHDRLLDGAAVVVGRRDEVIGAWPLHRRAISWIGVRLGRLRLRFDGAVTTDTMSGFFGTRTDLFRACGSHRERFEPRGYKVLFDFLKLLPPTTRLEEVPYSFGLRGGGSSKINATHLLLFARSLFRR